MLGKCVHAGVHLQCAKQGKCAHHLTVTVDGRNATFAAKFQRQERCFKVTTTTWPIQIQTSQRRLIRQRADDVTQACIKSYCEHYRPWRHLFSNRGFCRRSCLVCQLTFASSCCWLTDYTRFKQLFQPSPLCAKQCTVNSVDWADSKVWTWAIQEQKSFKSLTLAQFVSLMASLRLFYRGKICV